LILSNFILFDGTNLEQLPNDSRLLIAYFRLYSFVNVCKRINIKQSIDYVRFTERHGKLDNFQKS